MAPPDPQTDGVHRRVQVVRPLAMHVLRVGGTWQQGAELFYQLRELHRTNDLLLAYRFPGLDTAGEPGPGYADPEGSGLVFGNGYSIVGLAQVDIHSDDGPIPLQLLQLRNLWGPELSWRGAWSEESDEWQRFPEVRRHHLRPEHHATGRFWMSWEDFCTAFDRVEVCPMAESARKSSYVPQARIRRGAGSPKSEKGLHVADGTEIDSQRSPAARRQGSGSLA